MEIRKYTGVITRFLDQKERLLFSQERTLPLVIEAQDDGSHSFLMNFMINYSNEIKQDIAMYGAVLFRGFNISSTLAFQQTILSIQGMQGISHVFMPDAGRIHVDNLKFVLHPDSLIKKTGGGLALGGFHNENYYSADVAGYVSFFCLVPSKQGGETGLINMHNVYSALDHTLQNKLENSVFFVKKWPVVAIAQTYQMPVEQVKMICSDHGLFVDNEFVILNKPTVIYNQETNKKAIIANFSSELPGLHAELVRVFKKDYKGLRWIFHQIYWSNVIFPRMGRILFFIKFVAKNPKRFLILYKKITKSKQYQKQEISPRVGSVFEEKDIKTFAQLMREHYSSFLWNAGDIVIIDNTQIAHAGMPGLSKPGMVRTIRTMLCNPLDILYRPFSSGIQFKKESIEESLGEKLSKHKSFTK